MANTYNIAFEKANQFAIVDEFVNFNVLNGADRVTGLASDLSALGANGSTFTIKANESGDYDYKLTVSSVATGTNIPDELTEIVTVKYNDEEFASQGDGLTLCYLYKDYPAVEGYIGDEVTMSWTPGTVSVSNIADEAVATANDATITAVGAGSTTCTLTYTLDEVVKNLEGINIVISTPSVTNITVSDVEDKTATLSATSTPTNPTAMKFRYGLKSEFDPEVDTTYTEVEVTVTGGVGTYNLTGLLPLTEYACQAVIVYAEETYVSGITYFTTKAVDTTITFSDNNINLLGVSTFTKEVTASVEKVSEESAIEWVVSGSSDINITKVDNGAKTTITIKYIGENSTISTSIIPIAVTVTAIETLDSNVIATTIGKLNVKLYPVVNKVTLYVDENTETASTIVIDNNNQLEYSEYTPDGNDGTIYSYDAEKTSVTGVAAGEGSMTVNVTLDGDESINNYKVTVSIEVLNAFEYPTKEEILDKVIIFNYKSEMLGNYPGKNLIIYNYEVSDNTVVPFYLFRTNSPYEIKWEYDICALSADIAKLTLASIPDQTDDSQNDGD